MDLNFSAEDEAFRAQVREFIDSNYSKEIQSKVAMGVPPSKDDYVLWQRILHKQGWIAPNWPKAFGGTEWTPTQRYIFDEETYRAHCPRIIPFGLVMLGPVLMEFGSEAQQQRFLPSILDSTVWWAQGYSEPGAGSDLASLNTKAALDGDHYVVNGSKIWTTYAQYADWIFCLVRTSQEDRKQRGISFLLIDMDDPGVEVRPIVTMNGQRDVNEVFFKNVRVPAENLVGGEGQGWTIAKYLLGHERTTIAGVASSKSQIERVKRIAKEQEKGGRPLLDDPRFRDRIARIEIDLLALEYTNLRVLSDEAAGRGPGPEASLLKIRGTEIQQAITELLADTLGYYGLPFDATVVAKGWEGQSPIGPQHAAALTPHYLDWRKASIYGGTNEIQRNVMAKAVLGF